MEENKTPSKRAKGRADKAQTYLEKMVSKTAKFKVPELLEVYAAYDTLVEDYVIRSLLFPYSRFARSWLRDQARELLAGTDRNRIILTSRARKANESEFDALSPESKGQWAKEVKPKQATFLAETLATLHRFDAKGVIPTKEELASLGVSRLVYDDIGMYFTALTSIYPTLVADWCSAKAAGDMDEASRIDAYLRSIEDEVGVHRDDAWYVIVNVRSIYDKIEAMVSKVTMAYSRLLYRFAHHLRGVTTTEENFSSGYEGMVRAARNYDPTDGASFTNHCSHWVRSAVLKRQRQSSVILLPATTWYQLSLINKGTSDISDTRVTDLKERAEMFYASSSNASPGSKIDDDTSEEAYSYESVHVTSPDAAAVLGDSLKASQHVHEVYEGNDFQIAASGAINEAMSLIQEEDPTLLFPCLLWALNAGIDAPTVAEMTSDSYVGYQERNSELLRQETVKNRVKSFTMAKTQ
jgi:hypothetical protein